MNEPDDDLANAYQAFLGIQRQLRSRQRRQMKRDDSASTKGSREEAVNSYKAALARLGKFGEWLNVEVRFDAPPTAQALRAVIALYGEHVMDGTLLMGHDGAQDDFKEEEKRLLEPFLDEVRELVPEPGHDIAGDDVDLDLLDYVIIDSLLC
ncbi:hypothetical protein PG994_009969 [Apiospora phragmitis]|uniref:Uncharacterized protein n=1 Tax=Apiospora phragmitis TaxID=2905665 RepID=A0ABR1TNK1_9PEZI